MAEQRIVITIDENGKINAATEGIKGEMCLTELQELLGEMGNIQSVSKTDEFYQANELKTPNILKNKKL
ncbi:MAG: DUF2997 domain-containing protein [Prevotellaceae bacterium]|jgi:hypothetical protein|nr:DUF2997 domain-containing protein [Prevotellaceae bacterium]